MGRRGESIPVERGRSAKASKTKKEWAGNRREENETKSEKEQEEQREKEEKLRSETCRRVCFFSRSAFRSIQRTEEERVTTCILV